MNTQGGYVYELSLQVMQLGVKFLRILYVVKSL